ncbi:MAG: hypothetical protein IPL10_17395 [Bacteroidetes bacterium]|nr:hypothetical protein [Bacteroidota bacterium]
MKLINFTNRISLFALLFCILVIGYFVIFQLPINVFSYDVLGYYLYLPAFFNLKDVSLHNIDALLNTLKEYHSADGFYQAYKLENGNWVMKYPMGLSVLYYPFYLIGDFFAHSFKYPTDGFSKPYQLSVLFGCYSYTIVGLVFLRKIVLSFFTDKVSAVTILIIVFGTNYFAHVALYGQATMSHNLIFTLHAITVYFSIKWHKEYKLSQIIILAFTIGLAAISRPTEILIGLFPLFYGVVNKATFIQKWQLIKLYKPQLIVFSFILFFVISYQLFYWKLITGDFLFDSYSSNPGEAITLSHPYILEFLFSFRKGWLIYTPMMLFSIIGLYHLTKNNIILLVPILITFFLSFYMIASWSCWWYGSSYSSRAIIPMYVVLSIPLGYFINNLVTSKFKYALVSVFFILISLNLFQTWQVTQGILDTSCMTRAYYKSVFLQTSAPTPEQRKLLLIDKHLPTVDNFDISQQDRYRSVFFRELNFESNPEGKKNYVDSIFASKNHSLLTNQEFQFGDAIASTYKDITQKSYLWIKVSAKLFTRANPNEIDAGLIISMNHNNSKVYKFKKLDIRTLNLKQGEWNYIEMYYMTPDFWDRNDQVQSFFWNLSNQNIFIDDMRMEAMEPIEDETVF